MDGVQAGDAGVEFLARGVVALEFIEHDQRLGDDFAGFPFVELVLIFGIPAALTYTYGRMARDQREGWSIFAATTVAPRQS